MRPPTPLFFVAEPICGTMYILQPLGWGGTKWWLTPFFNRERNTCLVENASDEENVVRFALQAGSDQRQVIDFVQSILSGATIIEPLKSIPNPVLSKLKVNDPDRYDI